jgi:transposase
MASIVYGGLDTHKEMIEAYLVCPETGEVLTERVRHDRQAVTRAVRRWRQLGTLKLCYEASGGGFVLQRWLAGLGVECVVVAPSLIPKAPGNRVKTDRRDAKALALLHRGELLTPVHVPTVDQEAVRALVRLRHGLTQDLVRTKNRIHKQLRRLGCVYPGKTAWTKAHRHWLAQVELPLLERVIVETHLGVLDELTRRRQTIDQRLGLLAQAEPYRQQVDRLVCLRGVQRLTALVLVTELGDVRRFGRAGEVMSYAGLVPREASSGEHRRRGSITKAGNRSLRWVLGEAAWNQVRRPGTSSRLARARRGQPLEVVELAKRAEERLHRKFWGIALRKDRRTAATAVARELAGFVWGLLRLDPQAA